jgi:signal transduction histidine kinase
MAAKKTLIARFVVGIAAGATAAFFMRRPHRRSPNGTVNGSADGAATGHDPGVNGEADTQDPKTTRKLVGIIAHELRTPTSIILGYQELLSEGLLGPVNDRARDALDRIRRAAGQLRDLTDGLQILTGDVPERHDPGPGISNLNEIARRAVEITRPDAEARGIRLHLESNGDALVRAADDALDRLLDLVLAAALRATPEGTLILRIHADGPDIIAETRGAAFAPDLDSAALQARPDQIGSGLALRLAIAQRVARSLDGDLTVDRTTIRLRLPGPPHR